MGHTVESGEHDGYSWVSMINEWMTWGIIKKQRRRWENEWDWRLISLMVNEFRLWLIWLYYKKGDENPFICTFICDNDDSISDSNYLIF